MSRAAVAAAVAAVAIAVAIVSPGRQRTAPAVDHTPAGLSQAFAAVSTADRKAIAGLYSSLATAIERDDTLIAGTGVMAAGIGRSLDLAFDGRKVSPDGSLGNAIDAHVASALGFPAGDMLDVVMTPALRAKAAAALREVSAAAAR